MKPITIIIPVLMVMILAGIIAIQIPRSKAEQIQICPDCVCSEKSENVTNVYYNYTTITEPELPQVLRIAVDMAAEHDYDKDLYDCETYSSELVRRYQDSGYEAHVCQGDLGYEGEPQAGHKWVKVCAYVEPQTGEFLEAHRMKEDYHLEWCR